MELIEEVKACSYAFFKYVARFKGSKQWYTVNISTEDDRVVFNINNKMFTEMTNKTDFEYLVYYIMFDISYNKKVSALIKSFNKLKENNRRINENN